MKCVFALLKERRMRFSSLILVYIYKDLLTKREPWKTHCLFLSKNYQSLGWGICYFLISFNVLISSWLAIESCSSDFLSQRPPRRCTFPFAALSLISLTRLLYRCNDLLDFKFFSCRWTRSSTSENIKIKEDSKKKRSWDKLTTFRDRGIF